MKDLPMPTEPASAVVAGGLAAKYGLLAKLAALISSGILGALLIAAFDPPTDRRLLFRQAAVAGLCSLLLTMPTLRWLDPHLSWFSLQGDIETVLEMVLAVGFIIGAASWGLVGAFVKFRTIVAERGAKLAADRLGLGDEGKAP